MTVVAWIVLVIIVFIAFLMVLGTTERDGVVGGLAVAGFAAFMLGGVSWATWVLVGK